MKCKTVTLRKRKIKNGTQYSLCLDYYPGYRDNATMKVITREALGIYIFAKPANQQEKDFNARMMKKAAILRNQRYEAIFNENHGFFDKNRMKGDFLAYFKDLANRKNIKWQNVYKHFERFVNGKCTFDEVDVDLCRKFMEYLLDAPQSTPIGNCMSTLLQAIGQHSVPYSTLPTVTGKSRRIPTPSWIVLNVSLPSRNI